MNRSFLMVGIVASLVAIPVAAWAQADAGVPYDAARAEVASTPPTAEGSPWWSTPPVPYQPPSADPAGAPAANGPPPYPAPAGLQWVLVDPANPPPPPDPGFHKHDGFFMRALMGIASGRLQGDVATGELRIVGQGMSESFAFGGALKENLIVFGEYAIEALVESSASGPGMNPGTVRVMPFVLTFAPGVAYYFEPSNVYLSGALGLAMTDGSEDLDHVSAEVAKHESKPGIGGNLTAGKEWWVSSNWALGAALRASFARTQERTTGYPWTYVSAAALFSATYN